MSYSNENPRNPITDVENSRFNHPYIRRVSDLTQGYNWFPDYFPSNAQPVAFANNLATVPNTADPNFFFPDFPAESGASHILPLSSSSLPSKSAMSSTSGDQAKKPIKRIAHPHSHAKHKRPVSSTPAKRPAFILKLWNMVNDPANHECVQWADDGESFNVLNKENFEKTVLPKYFRHSNYSSFVRQLNMYGWYKVQDIASGAIQSGEEIRQFKSPYFIRGREDLLDNIARNKASKGSDDEEEIDMGRVLDELETLKRTQMEIAADLNRIKLDNQMLWKESYESRERHKSHAETFEKILRFLASMYTTNQNKFVGDNLSHQKQQRLLLPTANEYNNGQISEVPSSTGEIPMSIEELMSNTPSETANTPLNVENTSTNTPNRISTVNRGENVRRDAHISEEATPQSAGTSPKSNPATNSDTSYGLVLPNQDPVDFPAYSNSADPSRFGYMDNNNNNVLQDDNDLYSLNGSNQNMPSSVPSTTMSPSYRADVSPMQSQNMANQYSISNSLNDFEVPPDGINGMSSTVNSTTGLMPPSSSAASAMPLVSDDLFEGNQDWMKDSNTQKLLSSSNDIDNIIKNINYQGDSLQRIQGLLHRYSASGQGGGSPQLDPLFDVEEFLRNSAADNPDPGPSSSSGPSDMIDNTQVINTLPNSRPDEYDDLGPLERPRKRTRMED